VPRARRVTRVWRDHEDPRETEAKWACQDFRASTAFQVYQGQLDQEVFQVWMAAMEPRVILVILGFRVHLGHQDRLAWTDSLDKKVNQRKVVMELKVRREKEVVMDFKEDRGHQVLMVQAG
jgi:hypothetical protein